MKYLILIFILTNSLLAQDQGPLGIESFKDIEHKNKGCPINSLCSKENGKLILAFEKNFKIKNSAKRFKKMKEFNNKHGLPIAMLVHNKYKEKYGPILWNSRCDQHNPKNPHNTIYQGFKFLKAIPTESELHFDKVILFNDKKKVTYTVPYQDKPLFLKDDRMYFLKDYDDYFFQISLDNNGNFRLENSNPKLYSKAESKKIKEVPCPENKEDKSDLHSGTYCQKIWDIDTNELKTIQVFWSCP